MITRDRLPTEKDRPVKVTLYMVDIISYMIVGLTLLLADYYNYYYYAYFTAKNTEGLGATDPCQQPKVI